MEAIQNRTYLCIDGKSFYASVECAEHGLNPFETNLVVADPSHGKHALCLAISPKLKSLGVHNRCRLSDIPGNIKYEIALELYKRHVITKKIWIGIGYSRHEYCPPSQASIKLNCATQLSSIIEPAVKRKFQEIVVRGVPIRNLAIAFCDTRDEGCEGYDLFTDWDQVDREKAVERTVLEIRDRFGKNAVLRAINLNKVGSQKGRNEMIGGHRAGYDDPRKPRKAVHAL